MVGHAPCITTYVYFYSLPSLQIIGLALPSDSKTWAGLAQSVKQLATGWKVLVSNPGRGEIFHTGSALGPTSLL